MKTRKTNSVPMNENPDSSFDAGEVVDVTSIITESPHSDDQPIPMKKLSEIFDNCAKPDSHMRVFLRVRPMAAKCESTIIVENETSIVTCAPESSRRAQYTKLEERQYAFTRVFGPMSINTEVFDYVVDPLVDRFVKGESCVIFAYGMTNAGKTFTIQGCNQNPGILPRLVNAVLAKAVETGTEVQLSMLEIYQDKIYDLLGKKKEKLSIRDANGNVEVVKLTAQKITSAQESVRLLDLAASKRTKSQTLLNSGSSRSHAVYTVSLVRPGSSGGSENATVFQVVDLAGAERSNRTKATATQQKEANNINVSLMQLWRCLQSMKHIVANEQNADGNNADMVPYRESKLTHLLMPQLSKAGLPGVAMIACVNPQVDDYDETISILSNASLACKITEISDVLRAPARPSSSAVAAATVTSSEAVATDAVEKKRKRAEGSTVSTLQSMRESAIMMCNLKATGKRSSALKLTSASSSSATATAASNLLASTAATAAKRADESSMTGAVIDDLQEEIKHLQEMNDELLQSQWQRETQIREEVCAEMGVRSEHLLSQIHELQCQLSSQENSQGHVDVTKSCKKARKEHVEKEKEHMSRDLLEAEEELERTKAKYEFEVHRLSNENSNLETELATARSTITSLQVEIAQLKQNEVKMVSQSQDSFEAVVNPIQSAGEEDTKAAVEFSHRMQRDARFNHNSASSTSSNTTKLAAANRTSRSPLGPLSPSRDNSPLLDRLSKSPNLKHIEVVKQVETIIGDDCCNSILLKGMQQQSDAMNVDENAAPMHMKLPKASTTTQPYYKKLRSRFAMRM